MIDPITPSPEWYQPPDLEDDDQEPEPNVPEPLVVAQNWATWTAEPDADD